MKVYVFATVLAVTACASERIDTTTSLEPLLIIRVSDGYERGPVAVCENGRFSYNEIRRDTCAGHGGVRAWMQQ
ncbi:hypothetical protein [Vitreimonas sp.]|uniref:hypothetical protein n=1 Tax=Vitreimonas sp. TaxID=3069702 RepID=UPI002ED774C2